MKLSKLTHYFQYEVSCDEPSFSSKVEYKPWLWNNLIENLSKLKPILRSVQIGYEIMPFKSISKLKPILRSIQ